MWGSLGADLPCSELLTRTKPFPAGLAGEKGLSCNSTRSGGFLGWNVLAANPREMQIWRGAWLGCRFLGICCVRGRRAPLQGLAHPARGLLELLSINYSFFCLLLQLQRLETSVSALCSRPGGDKKLPRVPFPALARQKSAFLGACWW